MAEQSALSLILTLLFAQLCLVAAVEFGNVGNPRSLTVNRPTNAMDAILAINSQRTRGSKNTEKSKRSVVEDSIIEANDFQETSDDLLEGDIILDSDVTPEDKELRELQMQWSQNSASVKAGEKRQATRNLKWLWHDKIVPYEISSSLSPVRSKILKAIKSFNSKTCVQFIPRGTGDKNYVLFDKRQGCYSRIGRSYNRPGPQILSIGQYCDYEDIIIHEMLHAVGFYHEQSRPDRQNHVKIHWENVRKGFENEFLQYGHGQIDHLQLHYNYNSLMHYGSHAFSKSPKLETITAIGTKDDVQLGNSKMSVLDVIELDALYRCKSNKLNEWTPWSSYSPCDKYCFKNRQRFCYGKTPTSCGGKPNIYGVESQYVECSSKECPGKNDCCDARLGGSEAAVVCLSVPEDGNWSHWGGWTPCSRSCDEGKRTRTRKCDNPPPTNKGLACKGPSKEEELCVMPRCHLDDDDTDFRDKRLGIWENDIYDTPGLDWIIGKANTPTEGTGPHADHTTKKGFYLYVESTGRREKDAARLVSKMLPKTNPNKQCFRFFYHMYGRSIGSLKVRLMPKGQPKQLLFSKTGPQGREWKPAELTINTALPYQLTFEAVLGKPSYSDIAIDDVFLDVGSCDCKDKYLACKYWQKNGYCKKTFAYMYLNCAKSCNFCGCKDDPAWNCKRWTLKECKKNPLWMETNCPVTCQVCGCYDKNIWCHFWKGLGECERNPSYMKTNCRKACGVCK